jgi:hypothetical protein
MKTAGAPQQRPPARQQEREPLMHDQLSPTQRDDLRTQAGLMTLILSEHPTLLTLGDVMLEMNCDSEDAVTQAVRDLTAVGLLRREGTSILPTRAALSFDRLPL